MSEESVEVVEVPAEDTDAEAESEDVIETVPVELAGAMVDTERTVATVR